MVDPYVYDASALRFDEILRHCVRAGVLGEEQRHRAQSRDLAHELPVGEPGLPARVVAGIAVPDQILLGDDQPIAELREELHVFEALHLPGTVDDVVARSLLGFGDRQALDAWQIAQSLQRVVAGVVGQQGADAYPTGSLERRDQFENVDLRAGGDRAQGAGVDRHAQSAHLATRDAQSARQRTLGVAGGVRDDVRVVGVAGPHDLLVGQLDLGPSLQQR